MRTHPLVGHPNLDCALWARSEDLPADLRDKIGGQNAARMYGIQA